MDLHRRGYPQQRRRDPELCLESASLYSQSFSSPAIVFSLLDDDVLHVAYADTAASISSCATFGENLFASYGLEATLADIPALLLPYVPEEQKDAWKNAMTLTPCDVFDKLYRMEKLLGLTVLNDRFTDYPDTARLLQLSIFEEQRFVQ